MSKAPTKEKTPAFDLDLEAEPETGTQAVATLEQNGPMVLSSQGEQVRSAILDLARDANFDVEKLRALTEMQEQAEDRQAIRMFATAMAAAQSECQAVVRASEVKLIKKDGDKVEDKGSYKFASESGIDAMIRPIMTKYGFSVTHNRERVEGGLLVKSTLWHTGGHTITAEFPLALDSGAGKNNLQAGGSTDSYGRKYNLLGFFNIVRKGQDDDGVSGGAAPISLDEAAIIKKLVDEAGIGDGLSADERKGVIVEWFNDILGYALPKGYASIRQEDSVRVRRTLLSLKSKRLTSREKEAQI